MPLRGRLPNWPLVRLGVRARLVLSFLVAILPAFFLLLASDYRGFSSRRDASLAATRAMAGAATAVLQAELDQAAAAAHLASAAPDGQAGTVLAQILAGHPGYLGAFVLDEHGQPLAVAPADRPPLLIPEVTARAAAAEAPVLSGLLLSPPDNRPAFQVLVSGPAAGGVAGLAGVTLDAQALALRLAPLVAGGLSSVTVCDGRGWVVFSTLSTPMAWEERDWSTYAHIQKALQGEEAIAAHVPGRPDRRAYLAAAVPLAESGWVVSAEQAAPDPLAYLAGEASLGLLLFVALALLGLAAAVAVENRFTTPLSRLAQHARALGRGQLNERIALRTSDELEELSSALNTMAGQIEERDRRLRARTAELDAIITQSVDGIAIHGPQGELQRLNPAAVRILGRAPGRLGLSPAEQIAWFRMRAASGAALEPDDLPVAAALRGETRLAQELRIEAEEGDERFLAASASPLSDAHGHIYGAVTIFRDVTAAHRSQQEKDHFISLVSHELKTPITSIKGYAQMLLRRAEQSGGDPKDLKGLRIINEEVERMVDLINQLLDVSRLETQRLQLDCELVDLVALTADAADRLQMTTSRHTLRLRAPQQPIWVDADAMRLAQVLGNLIMNAIKYSPEGGPIEITVESREERTWVSVRDWGIGIAPEDQAHVFQRFYRGSRKGPNSLTGMGLGLYISREIIQRHHGDIVFHSQPGQGTTFLFWLPLARVGEPSAKGV